MNNRSDVLRLKDINLSNAPSSALPVQGVQMKMEWPKDGPNENWMGQRWPKWNGMAQDGPNKWEIINLEYAKEKSLEKSNVWTEIITLPLGGIKKIR